MGPHMVLKKAHSPKNILGDKNTEVGEKIKYQGTDPIEDLELNTVFCNDDCSSTEEWKSQELQ